MTIDALLARQNDPYLIIFYFFTLILFTTLRSSTHNICRVPCIKYPPLDRNLIIPWSFHPCSCTQFVSVSQEQLVSLFRWGRIRTVILGKSVVYRCHSVTRSILSWWFWLFFITDAPVDSETSFQKCRQVTIVLKWLLRKKKSNVSVPFWLP